MVCFMRRNAAQERRLIYLAIEGISNTATARKYGKGATTREIMAYTKLGKIATDSGLKFLVKWGIITTLNAYATNWFIKTPPPDNFCWIHGAQQVFGGKCIRCISKEGR